MTFTAAKKEEIRLRYLEVDTSNVADVLDAMNLLQQGLSSQFGPYPETTKRMAGWAYTIRGQMTPYPQGGDADKMTACQGISSGEISVWSGDGNGICYFGELIALGMKERGSVGALLDGGIRRTPVQSIGRWKVTASQVPVFMRGHDGGNVVVRPGDFILCDDDGAIVIPVEHVESVLIESERLTAIEKNIRIDIANGLSLADALKKYGHV